MATSYTSYSSSSTLLCKPRTTPRFVSSSSPSSLRFPYPLLSCFLASSAISISYAHEAFASVLSSTSKIRSPRVLAVVEEEAIAATTPVEEESAEDSPSKELKVKVRPCVLYVCNLPRSCDISQLLNIFKPFGTVQSVEVSRDVETGISRGCGYVTMSSAKEAKSAIAALDGSDVGGREMRVRFSSEMNSRRKKILVGLNSAPKAKRTEIFESPHRVYVGNLAWSVKPEDLREHFSQFGGVVSARVLFDRKAGRNRVYGFLSFSSAAEREAAISSSGSEFRGRTLLVREVLRKSEP